MVQFATSSLVLRERQSTLTVNRGTAGREKSQMGPQAFRACLVPFGFSFNTSPYIEVGGFPVGQELTGAISSEWRNKTQSVRLRPFQKWNDEKWTRLSGVSPSRPVGRRDNRVGQNPTSLTNLAKP